MDGISPNDSTMINVNEEDTVRYVPSLSSIGAPILCTGRSFLCHCLLLTTFKQVLLSHHLLIGSMPT